MKKQIIRLIIVAFCIFSAFGALFSTPASAHSHVVTKNTAAFPSQCTYKFNLGTSYMKVVQGSCDASKYVLPNTACGQSAEQDYSFSVNGDTIRTKIFYERYPKNCNDVAIGTVEEGVFAGSNPVTWYYFTYDGQGVYASCYYLNGDYGNYLPINANITAPAGYQPLFTNYKAVGCSGSAQGNYTPALT